MKYHKKFGFTLAEVLITLGIIGVVAALVIPSFVSNYRKHVIAAQLEKTYADLEKWIKASEVDNGPFESWDYSIPSKDFVQKYFAPYMELTYCTTIRDAKCFAGDQGQGYNMWKKSNGEFESGGAWLVYAPRYIMSDGRYFALYNRYSYAVPGTYGSDWKYVNFVIDVDGPRGESILGKDVYAFTLFNYKKGQIDHKGLKIGTIYTGNGDYRENNEKIQSTCVSSGYSCGLLIQRNGWKVPSNYPIKI